MGVIRGWGLRFGGNWGSILFQILIQKIFKTVALRGNLGNSGRDEGGDWVINSNHRGTGQGKMARDLKERVPWVTCGIPKGAIKQKSTP